MLHLKFHCLELIKWAWYKERFVTDVGSFLQPNKANGPPAPSLGLQMKGAE